MLKIDLILVVDNAQSSLHKALLMSFVPLRLRSPAWRFTLLMCLFFLLRVVLAISHREQLERPWGQTLHAALAGLPLDALIALLLTLPHFLWSQFAHRTAPLSPGRLWRLRSGHFLFWFTVLYLLIVEYFFFDEFDARFNFVAVDYLLFPHEVFVNLWESYPIVPALLCTAVIAGLFTMWSVRQARNVITSSSLRRSQGLLRGAIYVALVVALGAQLSMDSARISSNRVVNELTLNGYYSFWHALRTNELDYNQFYARMNRDEAYKRVREHLLLPGERWLSDDPHSIARWVPGHRDAKRKNVVLIVEESFGSEFSQVLHPERNGTLTPRFDELSQQGLLFTQLYATGNRTVRGLEAILTGFVPIPGQSIVKRPYEGTIFSLPTVFKSAGYQTRFIYGGYSYFDNMGPFALQSGFDAIVDQQDFADNEISYTTSWGVCDEDLFAKTLQELDRLHAQSTPFFTTVLTVSNHKPYLYPAGRIADDPLQQKRRHVVKYADFALGQFIDKARDHAFFADTVFVIVGDHGARVYGAQDIPLPSYEIPVLVYAPGFIAPQRDDRLASQLDVAPTLLGMLGIAYESQFFGRDLARIPAQDRYAFLSHNRDVALLKNNHIAVLSMQQQQRLWQVSRSTPNEVSLDLSFDRTLVDDSVAFYQVAYELYEQHRLSPVTTDQMAHSSSIRASH